MSNVTNIEDQRIIRAIYAQIMAFIADPPESDFLKGYLSGLMDFYREELGRGLDDPRFKALDEMCAIGDLAGYGTTKTCINCAWASGDGEVRECRFNPPLAAIGPIDELENPDSLAIFSKVFDEWWCGKWQARPTSEEVKHEHR